MESQIHGHMKSVWVEN